MTEQTALLVLSALLNLSDMQRMQLSSVFDATAKTAAPIAIQMEDNKEAIFEAVKSGKGDDQIRNLAAQQGSLTTQMMTLQGQTFLKMWAML